MENKAEYVYKSSSEDDVGDIAGTQALSTTSKTPGNSNSSKTSALKNRKEGKKEGEIQFFRKLLLFSEIFSYFQYTDVVGFPAILAPKLMILPLIKLTHTSGFRKQANPNQT